MNTDLGNGLLLERSQLPAKLGFDPRASIALVSKFRLNRVRLEKRFNIGHPAAGQRDMVNHIVAAGNDTRLAERGKSHRLSFVKLGVLKRRQAKQPVQHC